MSRVISFRLDENDPNERRVLAILDDGLKNEWTAREMIVRAMLASEGQSFIRPETENERLADELRAALAEVQRLADTLRQVGTVQPAAPIESEAPVLSDVFIASVKRGVKSGARLEKK